MATNTAAYSAELPIMPPKTANEPSPVYSARPIRPLPRRRIRSRLSEEQADSISYPPILPSSTTSYTTTQAQVEHSYQDVRYAREVNGTLDSHDSVRKWAANHPAESEEEEDERRQPSHRASWSAGTTPRPQVSGYRYPGNRPPLQYPPPPPKSSNSSADGYDESFENTKNKKKRKIPISGGLGVPPPDLEGREPTQSVNVPYPDSARANATGVGISGSGRGRNSKSAGRLANERRPLASTSSNVGTYANGTRNDKGIISTAMANAEGSEGYLPAKGQENVSLLQRQKLAKEGSQDFTFECESEAAKEMARTPLPPVPQAFPRAPNAPTTTSGGRAPPPNGAAPPQARNATNNPPAAQAPPPQKPRHDPDWWRRSARRRKEQKAAANYRNPPDPENPFDNYWCVYCEYEAIYGTLPVHLGRSYEKKERRRRRERETHQKRLEAAKAKSRKGKKSKGGAKSSNAATSNNNTSTASQQQQQQQQQQQPYDPAYADPSQDDISQGEDYFDDEFEDPLAVPAPLDPQSAHGHRPPMHRPPLQHGLEELPELDRSRSLPTHM